MERRIPRDVAPAHRGPWWLALQSFSAVSHGQLPAGGPTASEIHGPGGEEGGGMRGFRSPREGLLLANVLGFWAVRAGCGSTTFRALEFPLLQLTAGLNSQPGAA
jgi:hypothetical protein